MSSAGQMKGPTHPGAPSFLRSLPWRIGRKIYRKFTLVYFHHDLEKRQRPLKTSQRFTLQHFSDSDIPSCKPPFSAYIKDYREFLRRGNQGFAAVSKTSGEIGAMVWYAEETFRDVFYGCIIPVAEGEVFQMAGEVAKAYRNTPVTANLMFFAHDFWKQQGNIRRIVTLIQIDNLPSVRFCMNTGFKESGKMIVVHRIVGIKFYQVKDYSDELFTHLKKRKHTATKNSRAPDGF